MEVLLQLRVEELGAARLHPPVASVAVAEAVTAEAVAAVVVAVAVRQQQSLGLKGGQCMRPW